MASEIVKLEPAWILPLAGIVWLIFQKILLPKIKSSSGKEGTKEKELNWKKNVVVLHIVKLAALLSCFVLLTLFLTSDPHRYMGFPSSFKSAVVNFGIGGLIGMGVWIPYYAHPKVWNIEKERTGRMTNALPGPKGIQKYWVPITILLGAYLEEITFRGALIAVPAVLLTFPYDIWVIFVLISSFFAALHVFSTGPNKWDHKLYLVTGISGSFALGLIFIWRWSVIAAGTFHLMNNLIPWITYQIREVTLGR